MKWVWDFKWGKIKSDESGYIMVMAIFVLVITSLIAVGLAVVGANEFQLSGRTKLMDKAYQNAEAGISRAGVYIKDHPSVVLETGSGAHNYRTSPTAQWQSGTQDFGATGWEGTYSASTYSASIWQSDFVPDNPYYKVILSTGSVKRKNGETAERTIEARIIAGPSTTDYDASFDYCIYNGFYGAGKPGDPDYEAPTENGVWPAAGSDYFLGNMIIDGVTPYNGHSPKGAIYTRGSISIPAKGLSGCTIHGNIVATKNVTLETSYSLGLTTYQGIKIDNVIPASGAPVVGQGNVIAGLSGTGSANLVVKRVTAGEYTAPLTVSPGLVVAANDVTINIANNASFGGGDQASVTTGGIIAGGNVTLTKTGRFGASQACTLGNIFCSGTANIQSEFASVGIAQLSAGGTPVGCHIENTSGSISTAAIYSEGRVELEANAGGKLFTIGDVYTGSPLVESLNIDASASNVSVGNITAQGGVYIKSGNAWTPTIGTIIAGIDNSATRPGNGVTISVTSGGLWAGSCKVNGITALGSVTVGANSTGGIINIISGNGIWSGGDVSLTFASIGFANTTIGDISTRGSLTYSGGIWLVGTVRIGRISAEQNVTFGWTFGVAAWMYISGIKAGGNVNLTAAGFIGGSITTDQLNPWVQGQGTPDTTWPQQDPANDAIDAGGNISLSVASGWLVYVDMNNKARAKGTITTTAGVTGTMEQGVVGLGNFKPGVDSPGTPASPWTFGPTTGYPGSPTETSDWFKYKAPVVDQSLLLLLANRLETPVQFIEPNWGYFAEAAANDEGVVCPNPDCRRTNPKGATTCYNCGTSLVGIPAKKTHTIKDTGLVADGDYDGVAGNDQIKFLWDATNPQNYSSNETIYQGDPTVTVIMDVNWGGNAAASFKGSLVTKGGIKITDNLTGGWHFQDGQELNLVSGKSIGRLAAGFTWLKADKLTYHWWARYNIDLSDTTFTLLKAVAFNGSFTAGNRVIYNISGVDAFWKISTWTWTRWGLDSRAWLPAFTVLSYKEI